jgi:O-antigen/teichoic acid export membrane protein
MALRRAMILSVTQQYASLLISFLTTLVVARLLSPAEFGVFSVAMGAIAIMGSLKDLGVGQYIISKPDLTDADLRSAFGLSLAIGVLFAALIMALASPAGTFFLGRDHAGDPEDLAQALRIIALAQLLTPLGFCASILLARDLQFGTLLRIGVSAALAQSVVVIALAWAGWGSAALAWSQVAFTLAGVIGAWIAKPATLRLLPYFWGWRPMLGFGGWVSGAGLIGTTMMQLPELVIARMAGAAQAGLFSRANGLAGMLRNGLFSGIMRPALSGLARDERDGHGLKGTYLKIIAAVTGLAWPAFLGLIIWAQPLIGWLYGAQWLSAAAYLLPLALANMLTLAIAPHYDVLIVKRRPALLFACEAVLALAALGLMLLLSRFGALGIAWALTMSSSAFLLLYFVVLRPHAGFSLGEIGLVWARSAGVALICAAPAAVLRWWTWDQPSLWLPAMLGSALAAGVCWLLAVRWLRHDYAQHVGDFIGWAKAKLG